MTPLFVTAFGAEYQCLWEFLESPQPVDFKVPLLTGKYGSTSINVLMAGVGANSRDILNDYLETFPTNIVFGLGFCGGLSAMAKVGQVFMADRVLNPNGEVIVPPVSQREQLGQMFHESDFEFLVGDLLTLDKALTDKKSKRELNQKFGAIAVDMESFFWGKTSNSHSVDWMIVKVVMDDLETADYSKAGLKESLILASQRLKLVLPKILEAV